MNAAERRYIGKVKALDCTTCEEPGPSIAHHIMEGTGMAQRAGNYLTVPLCWECHVGSFSIHITPKQFKATYGNELDWLNKTIGLING